MGVGGQILLPTRPASGRQPGSAGIPRHIEKQMVAVGRRLAWGKPMPEQHPMSSRPITTVRAVFTSNSVKSLLKTAFEAEYGEHHSKAKAVANSAKVSPRTSEKWLRGENPPSLAAFFNLIAGPNPVPALQAEVRRLLAATTENDMTPERAIQEIQRMLVTMEKP